MVYISDPIYCLPHLILAFDDFGRISGFTINYSKLELYPVAIPDCMKESICSNFQFRWVNSAWHHLGIYIPFELNKLFLVSKGYFWLVKVRSLFTNWES